MHTHDRYFVHARHNFCFNEMFCFPLKVKKEKKESRCLFCSNKRRQFVTNVVVFKLSSTCRYFTTVAETFATLWLHPRYTFLIKFFLYNKEKKSYATL